MCSREHGQYHPDPRHASNWCIKCGCYWCWHEEAMAEFPALRQKYGHFTMQHKFCPFNHFWEWVARHFWNWYKYPEGQQHDKYPGVNTNQKVV